MLIAKRFPKENNTATKNFNLWGDKKRRTLIIAYIFLPGGAIQACMYIFFYLA